MEWVIPLAVLWLIVILAVVAGGSSRRTAAAEQGRRLALIERKLDMIMDSLGIQLPASEVNGPILQELLAGRKIQAIKVYREANGVGLKEAKDAVERIAREHGMA